MKTFFRITLFLIVSLLLLAFTGPLLQSFHPLENGPVRTFEKHCARCHGPKGNFYGDKFGSRSHKDLMYIVEEMMRGPAFLNPSEADVHAMTAYHHALNAGEPFICVTGRDSAKQVMSGEVALHDKFLIKYESGEIHNLTPDSAGNWKTRIAPGSKLIAKNDSATTFLKPHNQQWSHQKE